MIYSAGQHRYRKIPPEEVKTANHGMSSLFQPTNNPNNSDGSCIIVMPAAVLAMVNRCTLPRCKDTEWGLLTVADIWFVFYFSLSTVENTITHLFTFSVVWPGSKVARNVNPWPGYRAWLCHLPPWATAEPLCASVSPSVNWGGKRPPPTGVVRIKGLCAYNMYMITERLPSLLLLQRPRITHILGLL